MSEMSQNIYTFHHFIYQSDFHSFLVNNIDNNLHLTTKPDKKFITIQYNTNLSFGLFSQNVLTLHWYTVFMTHFVQTVKQSCASFPLQGLHLNCYSDILLFDITSKSVTVTTIKNLTIVMLHWQDGKLGTEKHNHEIVSLMQQ